MDKILIAEPIYHAMRPDVYANRVAFWKNVHGDREQGFYGVNHLVMGPRWNIRNARDNAIQLATLNEATHLFFIDDDIKAPPHILDVLRRVDRPIVGGLIHRDNGDPLVWRNVEGGETTWHDHPKEGTFECAAIAAGCMLIQIHVLKHLRLRQGDRRWLFNYDETERSMDVRFCRQAARNGFPSFCWPDIPCVQVKDY